MSGSTRSDLFATFAMFWCFQIAHAHCINIQSHDSDRDGNAENLEYDGQKLAIDMVEAPHQHIAVKRERPLK